MTPNQPRAWPAMPRPHKPIGAWVLGAFLAWILFCGVLLPLAVHWLFPH